MGGVTGAEAVDKLKNDADTYVAYRKLAREGHVGEIVGQDGRYFTSILRGLLSDEERLARSSYQALHAICRNREISTAPPDEPYRNPVKPEFENSALVRADVFLLFSNWISYPGNRAAVAFWQADVPLRLDAASALDWKRTMRNLRAGGAYDDSTRPEGAAFQKIRQLGPAAYPYLVRYITHEDIGMGRAAAKVLTDLTGHEPEGRLPNEATKEAVRDDWIRWLLGEIRWVDYVEIAEVTLLMACPHGEEEVKARLKDLGATSVETRTEAARALKDCALRHARLIRKTHEGHPDPEIRARLKPLVDKITRWEPVRLRILERLRTMMLLLEDHPDKERRERARRLHRRLAPRAFPTPADR